MRKKHNLLRVATMVEKINMLKARSILTVCFLVFAMLITNPVNASPKPANVEDKSPIQFETIVLESNLSSGVTMEYSYGYNFYGKYGRKMPIFAEVKNDSNVDFNGWLEGNIPVPEKGHVYRKEVNVKAGEKTKLSMIIPLSGGFGEVDVRLSDSMGNIILESRNSIKLGNYEKILFVGVLADDSDKLEYLDNLLMTPFLFNEETFPESKAYLDVLDIIIINDFNTSVLNDNQIQATKEWVLDGGTLVFGTGENANKVVSSVAEEFNIGIYAEPSTDSGAHQPFDKSHLEFQEVTITNHVDESYLDNLKSRIFALEENREFLRAQIVERNDYLAVYESPQIPLEDISQEERLSEYIDILVNPNVTKTLSNLMFVEYDNPELMEQEESLIQTEQGDLMISSIEGLSGTSRHKLSRQAADIYSLTTSVNGQDVVIYQKKDLGNGNILIYNFDLSMDQGSIKSNQTSSNQSADDTVMDEQAAKDLTFEVILVNSLIGNLSENKQMQIENEQNGSSVPYSITNSMSYTDTENIPQVVNYIIILIIYLLLIGPISYLILRHKDKHGLIWVIVPVTALIFTFIMYLAGAGTRVDEPFIGYVEMRTFKEDGIVEDGLYFSLTAPHNKNYKVVLGEEYENIRLIGQGEEFPTYYKSQLKSGYKKYMASVNYGTNETILEVNNNPAFVPVFFETSNEYTSRNPIQADIRYTGDKIEGTITNMSNHTITNGIYIGDAFLFNLGTIYSGQTLDISNVDKFYIHDINDVYSSEVIDAAIYGKSVSDIKEVIMEKDFFEQENINVGDANRKRDLIYALVDKHISASADQNCVMGFIEDNELVSFVEDISEVYDVYGTNAILSYVNIDYSKDGALLVPNISHLVDNEGMNYGLGLGAYPSKFYPIYLTEDEYVEEYYLPQDEEIISFNYYILSNQKNTSEYNTPFAGKIDALNRLTGEFEHIFTVNISENEDGTLIDRENLEKYLSKENVLTLKYRPAYTQMDSMMLLPNISYWKDGE